MNQITRQEHDAMNTLPAVHLSTTSLVMSDEGLNRMMRVADMMATGRATVPKHLQGNPGDCLAVTMQAMQWNMNPFAVGQKTHIVNGALGYEAQLVNAVVQSSGAIEGRFHYEYEGKSPAVSCRVGAVLRGEKEITWGEWLNESSVTTKNSPLWKTNPKQQLGYLQVKNWARAYTPGAILGVRTPDELEEILPRDMGTAQVVSPWTPEQLTAADEAAAKGAKAYAAWWKTLGKEVQTQLAGTSEHQRNKEQAQRADMARTVEAPAPAAAPAPAPTGEIVPTVAELRQKMQDAKTEDALYLAMDLVNALPEHEEEQHRADLEAVFADRLAVLRGGA